MSGFMDTVQGLRGVIAPSIPKRPVLIALVIGFLVGLAWAYLISRVTYLGTDPSYLDLSYQEEWVKLVADRVAASPQTSPEHIVDLLSKIPNPAGTVERLLNDPNEAPHHDKLRVIQGVAAQAQAIAAPVRSGSILGVIVPFIIAPIVVLVLGAIVGVVWDLLLYPFIQPQLKKMRGGSKDKSVQAEIEAAKEARRLATEAKTDFSATLGTPVMQKMSIYTPGRQYDDSFSIEDPDDKFLGECGAGISETIGDGSPQKVAAVEVWLFDKDDFVRTLTNVFATPHAANDPAIRTKLEPKGEEIVIAQPGAITSMETSGLRMQAKIVDVKYGTDPSVPPNSYFEALTIEIAVWEKDGAGAPAGATVPTPVAAPPPTPAAPPPQPMQPAAPPPPQPTYAPPQAQPAPPPQPSYVPPRQPPPPSAVPPRPAPPNDDPFGGTGDFNPNR